MRLLDCFHSLTCKWNVHVEGKVQANFGWLQFPRFDQKVKAFRVPWFLEWFWLHEKSFFLLTYLIKGQNIFLFFLLNLTFFPFQSLIRIIKTKSRRYFFLNNNLTALHHETYFYEQGKHFAENIQNSKSSNMIGLFSVFCNFYRE